MEKRLSTREAASKLGVALVTLQRHVSNKRIKAPPVLNISGARIRLWTVRDIEMARQVLATIRPGRKKRKA